MSANLVERAAAGAIALPTQGQGEAGLRAGAGCPNLTKALAEARDRCKAVAKDGVNAFHRYRYATADAVIEAASAALGGSGLALLPVVQEMGAVIAGTKAAFVLNRTLILSHTSGEYLPLEVRGWPVVEERGRPLDKAFAIALTSSLAYLLRDLLQMPRGTEDDVAAQDDTATAPKGPPKPVAPKPGEEEPPAGEAQAPAANGQAPAGPREAAKATVEAARKTRYGGRGKAKPSLPEKATEHQIARVAELREVLWAAQQMPEDHEDEAWAGWLKEWKVGSARDLDPGQCGQLIRALEEACKQAGAEAPPAVEFPPSEEPFPHDR